jgi:predicted HNH restriction endonuclease
MTAESAEQKLNRFECVIRLQMAEIDKLRAENQALVDWIQGDSDALTVLQTIYNSSTTSETNRVKAAAAAIGYERPKMMGATNLVVVDFRERVRQARLKAPLVASKTIEHIP